MLETDMVSHCCAAAPAKNTKATFRVPFDNEIDFLIVFVSVFAEAHTLDCWQSLTAVCASAGCCWQLGHRQWIRCYNWLQQ
jgi:hypothetical protein